MKETESLCLSPVVFHLWLLLLFFLNLCGLYYVTNSGNTQILDCALKMTLYNSWQTSNLRTFSCWFYFLSGLKIHKKSTWNLALWWARLFHLYGSREWIGTKNISRDKGGSYEILVWSTWWYLFMKCWTVCILFLYLDSQVLLSVFVTVSYKGLSEEVKNTVCSMRKCSISVWQNYPRF